MAATAVCAIVGLSASAIPKDWPNGWFAVCGFALIGFFPAALIAWILSRKDKSEYVKLLEAQGRPPLDLNWLRGSLLFWQITLGISAAVAFAGRLIPADWDHDIPFVGVIVFVLSGYMVWRRLPVRDLENRKFAGLQTKLEGLQAPSIQSDQPPVLYLRSFDADEAAAKLKGRLTKEEHLTQLLARIGPVVAIGRPGESLPRVGARRLYVNDEQWQSTVEELIKSARLVALRTGRSSGLRWELRKCVELLRPEQLLIVVSTKAALNEMLAELGAPAALPFWLGLRPIAGIRAFVIFREKWKPIVLRVKSSRRWYVRSVNWSYIGPRLAFTLRPVFAQLGAAWPRPAIGIPNIGISLAIIVEVVIFFGMWLGIWR